MLHFNSHHHPDELPDEYENIYVPYNHMCPSKQIGGASKTQLAELQRRAVHVVGGLNIFYGKQLAETLLQTPVFFTTQHDKSHFSPDPYSKQEISTYNTGTNSLYRNEYIAAVPPMCDSKNKIYGNVIPLQTVLCDKYNADLNDFLRWVKTVTWIKGYLKGEKNAFSFMSEILNEDIQENSLVKEVLSNICIPDGSQLSKLEILYDVASRHWIEPLFGNNGFGYEESTSLMESIVTSLSVLDLKSQHCLELCRLLQGTMPNEMQREGEEKLKGVGKEILKLQKYLEMLTKYVSPVNVHPVGILCTTFATHGDPFITKPRIKMNLRPVEPRT